ncbi:BglG family transcription antiterminator [Clostridium saccharoperbutylacetonicum]
MTRRRRDILNLILNAEEYITGNELARICNVSIRTIRSDIKEINVQLKEYNVEIDSSVKSGYFLNKKNKDILKRNNIIRKVLDYEYIIETPNSPVDRQMYILLKLANRKYITAEEFAQALYVSVSTINNDIVLINNMLKTDLNLGISYSLIKGIRLKADEKEKRNIISWVVAKKLNISTVLKNWNYLFNEKNVIKEARELYHIVKAETQKYNYYLSGHSYQFFCYEILVAVRRKQLGFQIEKSDNVNGSIEQVIMAIKEKVESKYEIILSNNEWLNLQQYFKSKQFLQETHISNIQTKEAVSIVEEFFKKVYKKYNIDLAAEQDNKNKLILYVAPMINRIKYRHFIANTIDEKVVDNYKLEYKIASEFVHIIKKELNLNVSLIELAYITMHLVSMCELWKYKLNAVLVCDYDESIIAFIKDKINNHFGEKIHLCRVYDYQEFMYENEENLNGIDFIITTSTIVDIANIPFVRINAEIENTDISMIEEFLENNKAKVSFK